MKTDKQEIRINLCDTCRKGCKVRREAIVSECSKYKLEPKAETILEQPKEVERCKCNSSKKTYNEQKHYYEDICITCGKPIVEEEEKVAKYCNTCIRDGESCSLHSSWCSDYTQRPPKPQAEIGELETFGYLTETGKLIAENRNKINELVRIVNQIRRV